MNLLEVMTHPFRPSYQACPFELQTVAYSTQQNHRNASSIFCNNYPLMMDEQAAL